MDRLQQAYKDGVVIGLDGINGSEPVERLDIDVLLLNHSDTFNLLLIAFKELKGEPVPWVIDDGYTASKDDKMYFFQIAGIHGLPLAHWDGEEGRNGSKELSYGYCAHMTPLFSTWHRPYLAMLEQALYRQAANIVERFERSTKVSDSEKQAYRDALKQFRLPYWDYFRPRAVNPELSTYDYHVPKIFTESQVWVKTLPDNELRKLANPFFDYTFSEGEISPDDWKLGGLTKEYDTYDKTIRWGGNEPTNHAEMNRMVNMIREDNMRMVLLMVDDESADGYPDFQVYSTAGLPRTGIPEKDFVRNFPRFGSLESTHGTYHVYVGGFTEARQGRDMDLKDGKNSLAGHIICVPLSAFEPIFWFHHCQIDRLFALWQAINPKQEGSKPTHWFEDLTSPDWKGAEKDPLYPFRREVSPEKVFWSSDDSRYTETFGYTYPDIEKGKSPKETRAMFKARYEWSRRMDPKMPYGPCPEEMLPLNLDTAQAFHDPDAPVHIQIQQTLSMAASKVAEATKSIQAAWNAAPKPDFAYEWFIDLVVERMAMNNAFTIFFVLGNITGETGTDWGSKPGFVGVAHIFTSPGEACSNCAGQSEERALVSQTIPIASALYDQVNKGQLASIKREDVEPFLKKNLKWRVQAVDGRVMDPRTLTESHNFQLGVSVRMSPLKGQDVKPREERLDHVIDDIIRNSS